MILGRSAAGCHSHFVGGWAAGFGVGELGMVGSSEDGAEELTTDFTDLLIFKRGHSVISSISAIREISG
jgi:hypothetical protein